MNYNDKELCVKRLLLVCEAVAWVNEAHLKAVQYAFTPERVSLGAAYQKAPQHSP